MKTLNWKIVGEGRRTTGHGESSREVRIQAEGCPVGILVTDASNYCTAEQINVIAEYIVIALRLTETLKDQAHIV